MQFDKAQSFMISKLGSSLPSYISYHDAEHTKSVIAAAEHLAISEGIIGEDLTLLRTAALFHDAGFLNGNEEHENLSVELARKYLPKYEYSTAQIEKICEMIMATKVPQSPKNQLARILCDADLYYLGGDKYFFYAQKLFRELKHNAIVKTKLEWKLMQINFLKTHSFFTKEAKESLTTQKQKTITILEADLAATMSQKKYSKTKEFIQDILLLLFGVFISGFAIHFFLLPNKLIDGGITGIYLLIQGTHHVSPLLIIALNIPFIILSFFSVGKRFAIFTSVGIILLCICLYLLTNIHIKSFSDDKLLMSIFGGVFLGTGIGLVMRAGAALDGIEVLALYTLKRTSFTITEIILGINLIIFSIAAYVFSIESALYSILTYFAATRCIDYVVEGLQAFTGVTIISGNSEELKSELVNNFGRGITVYKGERGFLPGKFEVSEDVDIIFTVIKRLELHRLNNLVRKVDPKAFVFANTIKEASGGILSRRHKH